MKIRLILLTILLSISLSLFATEVQKASFDVIAYKASSSESSTPFVRMAIVDALSGEVDDIDETEGLDLSSDIDTFLSQSDITTTTTTDITNRTIFSYRVTGNYPGKYTVSISFEGGFKPVDTTSSSSVDFAYYLWHTRYGFTDYMTHQGSSYTDSSGVTYALTESTGTTTGNTSDSTLATLTESWTFTISDSSISVIDFDSWISRGIISIALKKSEYAAADYGEYRTTATVALTFDEV